jgi:hypothetical protein
MLIVHGMLILLDLQQTLTACNHCIGGCLKDDMCYILYDLGLFASAWDEHIACYNAALLVAWMPCSYKLPNIALAISYH